MTALRNLLLLTACMLIGIAIAFYFRPQTLEQRIALGDKVGGDFELSSQAGPIKLKDFRGKVVLFFIGYTSCPDICPTTLALSAQAIQQLPKQDQDKIRGIFMSVDPQRDGLEKLAQYAKFFHNNFLAGTATPEVIDQIVQQYGAFYRRVELKDSALKYAIDHSSNIYLIDKNGQLAKALPHISSPGQLSREIQKLL